MHRNERIGAHVFMCMLAYYLEWHMMRRLQPLFERDGEGSQRCWTVKAVIDRLAQIQSNRVTLQGIEFDQITEAVEQQREILRLLDESGAEK